MKKKKFQLILIKPSHYDDDGYLLQWLHASTPSNTLAALYGLARDCATRQVLGEGVEIEIHVFDETVNRIRFKPLLRAFGESGNQGLVALCGVQSNQYPRAVDLAMRFREAGIPVCIGGFHVSGSIAMLDQMPPELQEAMDAGISLFAGEVEGRLDALLQDAAAGSLKPLYNFIADLPDLAGVPQPALPSDQIKRTGGKATVDAGRGCPFLCSFCTVINVHGRKSRFRSADDVERLVRNNLAEGINSFLITDDNFARNKNWEAICDRLIRMREEEGLEIRLSIQVDTVSHKIPGFIEKSGRAGVNRVFIGMENINPETLKQARKGQNSITEYRALLLAWQQAGAVTHVGYILGFPSDTPESIARDIGIIQRELPVEVLDFFILTPLPGSQDHKEFFMKGVEMDGDLNRYDTFHVTMDHPRMSRQELLDAYRNAWRLYYTPQHVETVLRRSAARGEPLGHMTTKLLIFSASQEIEDVHPLDAGLIRRKYRRDRRPGLPRENPLLFYPRYAGESLRKYTRLLRLFWKFQRIRRRVERDPQAASYRDAATTPVSDAELSQLEIFNISDASRQAMSKARRRKGARGAVSSSA